MLNNDQHDAKYWHLGLQADVFLARVRLQYLLMFFKREETEESMKLGRVVAEERGGNEKGILNAQNSRAKHNCHTSRIKRVIFSCLSTCIRLV